LNIVVVIVNYNSGELLQQCVQALERQTKLPSTVIIVDNASSDGSINIDDSAILNLQIVLLKTNVGFARANNLALDLIKESEFVALLNPDAFPKPMWLQELHFCSQQFPLHSFFASNMLDANNPSLVDGQGDVYHFSGLAWRRGHGHKNISENSDSSSMYRPEIFAACAGAAMYKFKDIEEVGGFDEEFFCYMEDVDLSYRLILAGKKGLYVPKAIVHHIGSAITGKRSSFSIYYGHRNLVWTYFKNTPLILLLFSLPFHLMLNVFSILYFSIKGQGKIILKSKYDALKGLPQILRKRTIIQKKRLSSVSYIFSLMNKKLFIFKR